jgi:hypothetical protein
VAIKALEDLSIREISAEHMQQLFDSSPLAVSLKPLVTGRILQYNPT